MYGNIGIHNMTTIYRAAELYPHERESVRGDVCCLPEQRTGRELSQSTFYSRGGI